MTGTSPSHYTASEQKLRFFFRYLNKFMLLNWRLGFGTWFNPSKRIGNIMVIGHTGRKSGLLRRTPVNYAIVDDDVYCTAAMGKWADWYRNIMVNPRVEIWHPDGRWMGTAVDVSDSPERLILLRQVLIGSGFAAYVAGINPQTISDDELARTTEIYRLVRIDRQEPMTGPGGPGDLAWIWPVSTIVLLLMLLLRRSKK